MNAIELLLNRTSSPALTDPAPSAEQLQTMLSAATRAPDHGSLRPYRFLVIKDEGLDRLGELFLRATKAQSKDIDETKRNRLLNMPRRAPMILAVIAVKQDHPKVPYSEQVITAGCAAQAVVQAAFALGLGAMWRSGDLMFDPYVSKGLGLEQHEEIVGFIYLGQPLKVKEVPIVDTEPMLAEWPGE